MLDIRKLQQISYTVSVGDKAVNRLLIFDPVNVSESAIIKILNTPDGYKYIRDLSNVLDITEDQYVNFILPMLRSIEKSNQQTSTTTTSKTEDTIKIPSISGEYVEIPATSIYAIGSIFRSIMKDFKFGEDVKIVYNGPKESESYGDKA